MQAEASSAVLFGYDCGYPLASAICEYDRGSFSPDLPGLTGEELGAKTSPHSERALSSPLVKRAVPSPLHHRIPPQGSSMCTSRLSAVELCMSVLKCPAILMRLSDAARFGLAQPTKMMICFVPIAQIYMVMLRPGEDRQVVSCHSGSQAPFLGCAEL